MQEIQWDAPAPGPGPNTYMEVLVKETVTLHKVLSKYLPAPTVEVGRHLTLGVALIDPSLHAAYHDPSLCCRQPQAFRGVRQDRAPEPGSQDAV